MSNDRKGYYMKPGARATAPGVVFTVDVETTNQRPGADSNLIVRRFKRASLTVSQWRRGRWSPIETGSADAPESAREWMESRAVAGRTNWVLSSDGQNTLTLLNWWDYAVSCGVVQTGRRGTRSYRTTTGPLDRAVYLEALVVRTGTTILTYTQSYVRWKWAGIGQLVPSGLDQAEHGIASDEGDQSDTVGHGRGKSSTSAGRASDISDQFRALCDWWRASAKAPFGATVGQLAVGMLRSHIAHKALCTHSDGEAHGKERQAAFGGRASVWYIGKVGETVVRPVPEVVPSSPSEAPQGQASLIHIDVRSMYPTLLRDMPYPVKLKSYQENPTVADVLDLSRDMHTIARVTVETEVPEYPHRERERVHFPVGRFTTTLTGPELLRLSTEGEILKCHELCVYSSGRPFAGAAGAMLEMRAKLESSGDKQGATFAKLLANSLGGKLAQRCGGWVRWAEEDTPGRWGEEWIYDQRAGTRTRCRHFAGMCWQWLEDATGKGPYTFAFAYLAAYGRLQMRAIRELCPPRTVVSQDTDGLWVLPPAVDALIAAGHPEHDGPGSLRIDKRASWGRFWGPRHYCVDGHWTLAGFQSPVVQDDEGTIRDVYDISIWGQKMDGPPSCAVRGVRESHLRQQEVGGDVGPDGWVTPTRLPRRGAQDDL